MGRGDRCGSRRRLRLRARLARAAGSGGRRRGEAEPARYLSNWTDRQSPRGFSDFYLPELSGPENRAAMTGFVMDCMSDHRERVLGQSRTEKLTER
jgi:hypothetical protein